MKRKRRLGQRGGGGVGKHRGGGDVGSDGGLSHTVVDGHAAHFRIRNVNCGKNCSGCPHKSYRYLVWRDDAGRVRERYVGIARADD